MRPSRAVACLRRTVSPVLLLVVLLLSACSGAPRAAPPPGPPSGPDRPVSLVWRDCARGFECSVLPVPRGDGERLDLAVTRHRATRDRVGVLVVNPGGPGASAVDSLQGGLARLPVALRERFDLVAVDPLGVGHSAPVRCGTTAELDAFFALDPDPDDAVELAALEAGSAALARGCAARAGGLLAHVSTAEAAADLDRLRRALGEERIDYLGYSYGTAIGAAYLDAFPTRVRAAVLDGALDPTLSWDALLEGQARGFDAALLAMLDDCERTACPFRRAVTGPLPEAYDALAARVDAEPLRVGARVLGPGELSLGAGAGLYSRASGWPAVQAALAAAVRGDGAPLLALSDGYLERTRDGYAPVVQANVAVNCVDRPWPREAGAYVALAERLATTAPRFGPAIALSGLPCATWPVPPVSVPHEVGAPDAPPVVVVGTTGDPATPYAWSQALAAQLAAGVLVTHVGDGHTAYRAGAAGCLVGPVTDYLVSAVAPPALTC